MITMDVEENMVGEYIELKELEDEDVYLCNKLYIFHEIFYTKFKHVVYLDITWTNIDLIWTSLISMTMVDIKNYMVEEYIKIQHLCVIHVLCLDFYREFKNLTYYDFIWFCKILGIKHVSHITVFICWNLIYCTTMYSLMYKRIMEMRVSQMVSICLIFLNSL